MNRTIVIGFGFALGCGGGIFWVVGCEPTCDRTLTCPSEAEPVDAGSGGGDADGAGGGSACTDGTGMTVDIACDAWCTTPVWGCGGNGGSPACVRCREDFYSYWPASAEAMGKCLSELKLTQPCIVSYIEACEAQVADAGCDPDDAAATSCSELSSLCGVAFSAETCSPTLKPFHVDAQQAYLDCMSSQSSNQTCDTLHATCIAKVRTDTVP